MSIIAINNQVKNQIETADVQDFTPSKKVKEDQFVLLSANASLGLVDKPDRFLQQGILRSTPCNGDCSCDGDCCGIDL